MLAKYESHQNIRQDRLCPFRVHYECRIFNSICNWHQNIEIILILSGSGTIHYGTENLAVYPGDIIVVNSNVLHCVQKSDNIRYHCIIIEEDFCKENGIFTNQLLFEQHFRCDRTQALCQNAAECCNRYSADETPLNAAKTRLAVLSLLIDLCENHLVSQSILDGQANSQRISEMHVKKAASYLEAHCTEQVSLDYLAKLCGISKCHLSREFKRYTGQTIMTYVNLIRCMRAQQSIASGKTVTEAALLWGFESVSYFSRVYKKLMGSLPSKVK